MTAMPTNTNPDRFDLLELDSYRSTRTDEPHEDEASARFELLEMDALPEPPVTRSEPADGDASELAPAVLEDDIAPEYNDFGGPPDELTAIAAESSVNAAAPSSGTFGSIREVTANNAVESSVLPVGEGIRHVPAGPSIFELPAAERRFIVGQSANESDAEVLRPGKLVAGELVAGAVAEGHGVLVGWHGDRQITRAVLVDALTAIGREDWAPKPKDARAQAGRAMAAAGGSYHVKADRKTGAITRSEGASTGRHVWRLGRIDTMGGPGDAYGMTVAIMTLSPDGTLSGSGDMGVINAIRDDYADRCAKELYTSADLTAWLAQVLATHCGGVSYAVGWYIPAKHRAAATALCNAVSATGWGNDWLGSKERPALPIATCDELRDGIARGLKDEVAQVLGKLHTEREAARLEKERRLAAVGEITAERPRLEAEVAARRLAGDIGAQRAGTFLKELRAIATRVAAYSEILGDERCGSARRAVHEATCELEGLLGDNDNGISQRFGAVWDEIMLDVRKDGGVL